MSLKKISALVLALVVLVGTLAGCGGSKTPPASSSAPAPATSQESEAKELSGHIVVYTSEPQDLATEALDAFVARHPKVTYELFRSGTGNVISKIDTELQTGKTEADIIWFADIGYIKQLDDKGLITHYSPENAKNIDPQYAYNNGMGHEVRLIYNVLAYNTTKVTNPPKDWMDVTGPDFKGSFAMANPNYSGGAFTALMVHTQYPDLVGWDFYTKAAKNDCKYEQSNGNLQTKVSSGEYSAVAIVDFMARNAKNEGSPVEVVWPESGAVLVPTPIALMSTIDEADLDAAKAFVNFMFELETQKLFVEQGYIPVVAEAGVPEGAPKASEIKTMAFDLDYFVKNSSDVRAEYTRLFGAE